ncbi:MAG: hypothetical protein Q8P92_03325 [Candidatus Daviesbacteria bacterium]|nr:hypothetical protein [Candidatus Daviesbacteria bacterium]
MIAKLLISADLEKINRKIGEILKEAGTSNPHSDLLYLDSTQKMGIEQAREIKKHLSFKPLQSKGKAVVLEEASNLTEEAQNALLKTLEELPEDAIFIMATDSESKLLPTVLSRCQIIRLQVTGYPPEARLAKGGSLQEKDYSQDVERLLRISVEQRFEYIEKLKDRKEFLHSLVSYFHQNLASHLTSGNTDYKNFLKELLQAEQWAAQNVNIRAILEYLMLSMPKEL